MALNDEVSSAQTRVVARLEQVLHHEHEGFRGLVESYLVVLRSMMGSPVSYHTSFFIACLIK